MRYVAFLRAINTGKRRIKMADLRELYVDLGYRDAATYIATGNVIFDAESRPDTSELESEFEKRFGFEAEVFLRDEVELADVIERVPWDEEAGSRDVSFLERVPDARSARTLEMTAVPPEQLSVSGAEVFSLREGPDVETVHKESTTMRILDTKTTRRGIRTVEAISAKFLHHREDTK
ncbi:MAG: DUF1697 domain-containing protein [Actinomycetota bacterium]